MFESLTQQSHPRLWLLFHSLIGAPGDKRRIALEHAGGRKRILEIGCSLGVVAEAFRGLSDTTYLGIDIDGQAIRHARALYRDVPRIQFEEISVLDLHNRGETFDYVLFGNILHHVDDETAVSLMRQALRVLSTGGIILIMEPDIQHPWDNLLLRVLYKLERGQFRRGLEHLEKLAAQAGVRLTSTERRDISIGLLPGITGGRMLVLAGDGGTP